MFNQMTELEQSTSDTVVKSSPPRVLIVEDQANERELLATCLRLGGIEVQTASNGREAFDLLHEQDLPDLVLLDMRMPDVDGPTFLQTIRDDIRLHNLRVFAVSGTSRADFGPNPLPIDGWFSKPVRVDALLKAVANERATPAISS
jgi:CheY-like chemotaxis protein